MLLISWPVCCSTFGMFFILFSPLLHDPSLECLLSITAHIMSFISTFDYLYICSFKEIIEGLVNRICMVSLETPDYLSTFLTDKSLIHFAMIFVKLIGLYIFDVLCYIFDPTRKYIPNDTFHICN